MAHAFRRIVSLGSTCQTQYQVRRLTGDQSERFRKVPGVREVGLGCPSSVFSWQITPIDALLTYLERDFHGMMELADLVPSKRTVVNRVHGTEHHHEFSVDTTEASLLEQFPAARRKHDVMCDRTRRILRDDEPTLFVLAAPDVSLDQTRALETLLRRYNPSKTISLLQVEDTHTPDDWKGNDEVWDQAFSNIVFDDTLTPAEQLTATYIRLKTQLVRAGDRIRKNRLRAGK